MKIKVRMQENSSSFNAVFYDSPQEFPVKVKDSQPITILGNDYNDLKNKPSINDIVLEGNLTSEDLGISASFPSGGLIGDLLTKISNSSNGVGWVTPASSAEQDNTRPITAAAVYTEIGNINALLATI